MLFARFRKSFLFSIKIYLKRAAKVITGCFKVSFFHIITLKLLFMTFVIIIVVSVQVKVAVMAHQHQSQGITTILSTLFIVVKY